MRRQVKKSLLDAVLLGHVNVGDLYNHDEDLLVMKQHVSEEFLEVHNRAFDMYVQGNWAEAKENFEMAIKVRIQTVCSILQQRNTSG